MLRRFKACLVQVLGLGPRGCLGAAGHPTQLAIGPRTLELHSPRTALHSMEMASLIQQATTKAPITDLIPEKK